MVNDAALTLDELCGIIARQNETINRLQAENLQMLAFDIENSKNEKAEVQNID